MRHPSRPARFARRVVRLSAWIAPAEWRARWREEWLAEIDRAIDDGRSTIGVTQRTLGPPVDALALRIRSRDASWPVAAIRADLRDALRSLRRTPGQTLTVFGGLTLGTVVTVFTFGIVNAVTVGSLPGVHDRSTLVRVLTRTDGDPRLRDVGIAELAALPAELPGLAAHGTVAWISYFPALEIGDDVVRVRGQFVSGGFFATLGTTPALGRLIQPADDDPAQPPVAVLGHRLWRTRFGADPELVGRTLLVVAVGAAYVPARRAMRTDPMLSLRAE